MLSLIISIIALGLIIAFHEFGHFITARLFKVGVIEFSIGMGPRVLSKVKGNTRYSLRAMPFGGSCMMLGEEMAEDDENDRASGALTNGTLNDDAPRIQGDSIIIDGRTYKKSDQFVEKPAWQRFLIIAAGPVFNFILAFLFALIITAHYGYDRAEILDATSGMPAAEAGISAGDEITGLAVVNDSSNGIRFSKVETARDVQLFMVVHADAMQNGGTFAVRYLDADDGMSEKSAVLKPQYDDENKTYRLGFSYSSGYEKAESLGEVLHYSMYDVGYCIRSSVLSVKMLISGSVSRRDVMGPVRMVAVMDETVATASYYGIVAATMTLLNIMVLISGSLGAMNLLPLPALDGGRLVFIAIELITGHAVPKELEGRIHMAGMLLLLALMVFILFNDVSLLILG